MAQPRARAFLPVRVPHTPPGNPAFPHLLRELASSDPVALKTVQKTHRRYQEMSFTKVLFSAIPALMSTIDENLQNT